MANRCMDPVDLSKRFPVNRPGTKVLLGFAMFNQGQVEAAAAVANYMEKEAGKLARLCAGARSSERCPHCQMRRVAQQVRDGDWLHNRAPK